MKRPAKGRHAASYVARGVAVAKTHIVYEEFGSMRSIDVTNKVSKCLGIAAASDSLPSDDTSRGADRQQESQLV